MCRCSVNGRAKLYLQSGNNPTQVYMLGSYQAPDFQATLFFYYFQDNEVFE